MLRDHGSLIHNLIHQILDLMEDLTTDCYCIRSLETLSSNALNLAKKMGSDRTQ